MTHRELYNLDFLINACKTDKDAALLALILGSAAIALASEDAPNSIDFLLSARKACETLRSQWVNLRAENH